MRVSPLFEIQSELTVGFTAPSVPSVPVSAVAPDTGMVPESPAPGPESPELAPESPLPPASGFPLPPAGVVVDELHAKKQELTKSETKSGVQKEFISRSLQ